MLHSLSLNKAKSLGAKALESSSAKKRSPKQEAYANILMDVCDEYGLDHPFQGSEEQSKEILKEASRRWENSPLNTDD